MSLTQLALDRILAQVSGVQSSGVAANLATIKRGSVSFPAVFVVPVGRRGGSSRYMTGRVAQKRDIRIQVVMAVRNLATRGGGAMYDIEQLYDQVDAALFGWAPDGSYDPLVLTSGQILEIQNGEVWWVDEYVTAVDRRT